MRAILAAAIASLALAGTAQANKPVALRDATIAPTYLRLLQPGRATTIRHQCGNDYWTELSAYRWNGEALPAQSWNADHDWMTWGRVLFDGITWRNLYRQPVLVAGWCE